MIGMTIDSSILGNGAGLPGARGAHAARRRRD
jgi:hypothetical protein